jgi:hypothetical protein
MNMVPLQLAPKRLAQAAPAPALPVGPIVSAGPVVANGYGAFPWTPLLVGGAILAGIILLAGVVSKD